MKETPAERLRQARIAADFKTMKLAAASLAVEYPTYAGHENGRFEKALKDTFNDPDAQFERADYQFFVQLVQLLEQDQQKP